MNRRRLVRVPATSANLGPGFDVLAAALSPALELEIEETGVFAVETSLDVPRDRSNLLVRAFEQLHPADDFTFRVRSDIPLTGGLGSSASAVVAGLAAADHMFELDADLLAHATALEGHTDNAAAALSGGFVVCAPVDGATAEITKIDPPAGLEGVLVIPPISQAVPTAQARAALPAEVPLSDVVFTAAHTAMLVMGVTSGDWDLLAAALKDRIHQPRRAHLYPRSIELVERATELGALGATISGAGPTVLFWTTWEQTGGVHAKLTELADAATEVRRVNFSDGGLDVQEL